MTIRPLYPSIEPSLNLDFANTKRLDSRISFSRSSSGTYVDANGVIQSAATNVARFDHSPTTGESLGLLIEEARTNLVTYSEQFDNAAWAKISGTVTANSIAAPDGNATADTFSGDGTNNPHSIDSSAYNTAGPKITSVFAKAGTHNFIQILYGADATVYANFNLSNGTIGSTGSLSTAAIQPLSNGWYRCSLYTSSASATKPFIALISSATSPRYESNTISGNVYLWGAQIELGAFPTSYIPTVASTVTRSADVASITGSNFSSWYNQSEGTICCDVITRCPLGGGNSTSNLGISFALLDTAGSNYILGTRAEEGSAQGNNFKAFIYSSGATVLNAGVTNSWLPNVLSKQSIAYKANSFNFSVNGTLGTPVTTGAVPININRLDIGEMSYATYNRIKAGTFARLAYWPVRLSDAILQSLTR